MDSDVYSENLLDHYENPRNFGNLSNPTNKASDVNLVCGDVIEFQLRVEKNIIKDVKFKCSGCAISKASASMLSEKVKNMKIEEVKKLDQNDIFEMLGIRISEARVKCALLSLAVLNKAIINKKGGV
jgi:nitrogen fixation NifU-like protein